MNLYFVAAFFYFFSIVIAMHKAVCEYALLHGLLRIYVPGISITAALVLKINITHSSCF
jgi:hypothetical protein